MNLTEGVIWKSLLLFFLPLLFGSFVQTLYSMVDAMMVGRFVGETALSAVGGTDYMLIVLYIGLYSGLSTGANIVISQLFGAGREKELYRTSRTAMWIGLAFGVLLGIASYALTPAALEWLKNPADTMQEAVAYLQVYSVGIPAMVIYNMGAGILRGVGDSQSPTAVMVVSSVLNIVLDGLLIIVIPLGAAGAAAATVLAQIAAAVWIFAMTEKRMKQYREGKNLPPCAVQNHAGQNENTKQNGNTEIVIDIGKNSPAGRNIFADEKRDFGKKAAAKILKIGIPAALQSMTYSIANIITQVFVNGFGSGTVAAWAVFGKVDSIFWMAANTFGIAVTTYMGQNYGAGKYDRVRKGLRQGTFMIFLFTAGFTVFLWLFAGPMYRLFNNNEDLIELGVWMARNFAPFYFSYVGIETFSAVLRGIGEIKAPTFIMVGGICGVRILWLYLAVPYFQTFYSLMLVYPVSWIVSEVLFMSYFLIWGRKKISD